MVLARQAPGHDRARRGDLAVALRGPRLSGAGDATLRIMWRGGRGCSGQACVSADHSDACVRVRALIRAEACIRASPQPVPRCVFGGGRRSASGRLCGAALRSHRVYVLLRDPRRAAVAFGTDLCRSRKIVHDSLCFECYLVIDPAQSGAKCPEPIWFQRQFTYNSHFDSFLCFTDICCAPGRILRRLNAVYLARRCCFSALPLSAQP